MNKLFILRNAQQVCSNFNSGNSDIKLKIATNAKKLADFYKTYDGVVEFLYIAPKSEIKEAIENGAIYLEVYVGGELAAVAKTALLKLPYPFFVPPKELGNKKDFWGLSGLYVNKKFRGRKLSTVLLNACTAIAENSYAQGIYADFDYRNIDSMRLVSKYFDFVGYTDGRNGSPDEATIYTTFYKDFRGCAEKRSAVEITFDKFNCDHARETLDKMMENVGSSTKSIVQYDAGHNEIVCFDKPYVFEASKVIMKPYEQGFVPTKENFAKLANNSLDIYCK